MTAPEQRAGTLRIDPAEEAASTSQTEFPNSPSPSAAVAARSELSSFSALNQGDLPKLCPTCGVRYPVEFNVCPRDATGLVDAPMGDDENIGLTLAQTYTLVRLVGEGGMGRVYEARHTRIRTKRFAVKLLHPEFARNPEVLTRFQREAETAASIDSPYVASVLDVHRTQDGQPFIVAEFLEGKELAEHLLETGKTEIAFAVRVVRQICRALILAHERGIIHRDLKPENVFLTGDLIRPTAKVLDFGLSKVHGHEGTNLTRTGVIMGTPAYMAPEQARGEHVDHRADIYAVGAILYNMLTGRRPFNKPDPTATITAVLLEDPERPSVLNPAIPPGLELTVQRAMAKVADQRYPTMAELEAALAAFDTIEQQTRADTPSVAAPNLMRPRAATDPQMGNVAMARPMLVLMMVLGGLGVLTGLFAFVGALIRFIKDGGAPLSMTESLLVMLLILVAFSTPGYFFIRQVRTKVWNNTAHVVTLSQTLTMVVAGAFVTYGLASLWVRFVEAVVLRQPGGMAWPGWDIVLTLVAATGGAIAYFLHRDKGN